MKRSIDFTQERTERLGRIAKLMGISGVYGELPQTIDFCVTCTEKYLELMAKVTPKTKPEKMAQFFQAVSNLQKGPVTPEESLETWHKSLKVTPLRPEKSPLCNPKPSSGDI